MDDKFGHPVLENMQCSFATGIGGVMAAVGIIGTTPFRVWMEFITGLAVATYLPNPSLSSPSLKIMISGGCHSAL